MSDLLQVVIQHLMSGSKLGRGRDQIRDGRTTLKLLVLFKQGRTRQETSSSLWQQNKSVIKRAIFSCFFVITLDWLVVPTSKCSQQLLIWYRLLPRSFRVVRPSLPWSRPHPNLLPDYLKQNDLIMEYPPQRSELSGIFGGRNILGRWVKRFPDRPPVRKNSLTPLQCSDITVSFLTWLLWMVAMVGPIAQWVVWANDHFPYSFQV
eukprot:sb/3470443/